jgi:polar amino acid transport system substrate-binding protein
MDIEIEDIEFDAIISAVSSHKADVGIAGMTMTQERAKSINFSDSYVTSKQVMIVRGDNASFSNIGFIDKVYQNFVQNDRWAYVLSGLKNTLIIALCAVILGVFIGFLVGIVRVAHDKTGVLPILNAICKLYLTIIRGTPAMIQLLIIYYVVFQSVNISKILVAVIAFAINSGAYVAEIIRGGIMSIDEGQTEAGRSLGLNYRQTMIYIILPQAVKNVLPSLANEFITLIKETSVASFIAVVDLQKTCDNIRNATYNAWIPLLSCALIYLCLTVGLTKFFAAFEKKMAKSDRSR